MTEPELLRAAVHSVGLIDYTDSSFSLGAYPACWTIAVDSGPSADDVLEWRGENLRVLLTALVQYLAECERDLNAQSVHSLSHREAKYAIGLLDHARRELATPGNPIEVAFIPNSRVDKSRPWEVTFEVDGKLQCWMGDSLQASLAGIERLAGR